MIVLYERPDCPFCWKVRLALAELGLAYESVQTRLGEKHPQVQRLSPVGTVPVLVDGDTVIWESGIMLDYLDGRYAPGKLLPGNPAEQARVRTLHAYSDKCVGAALRGLVFEKRSKPRAGWDRQLIVDSEQQWLRCQAWLEEQLAGREYFGDGLSAADCALAVRCGVAWVYGAEVSAELPRLAAWFDRVRALDSWEAAWPVSFIGREYLEAES